MHLHPKIIAMHIADTTACACRPRRHHAGPVLAFVAGAAVAAGALVYLLAKAAG